MKNGRRRARSAARMHDSVIGRRIAAIKNVRTGAHGSLPAPKGPDDLLRI
jgi:hypothetical protein